MKESITIASEPWLPREVGHLISLAVIDVITKSSPEILEFGAIIYDNLNIQISKKLNKFTIVTLQDTCIHWTQIIFFTEFRLLTIYKGRFSRIIYEKC